MKNNTTDSIKVRYGFRLIVAAAMPVVILGCLSGEAGLISGIVILPVLALMLFRPFLVTHEQGVKFVSLISDKFFRSASYGDLERQLPAMRWFLRDSDLILLDQSLGDHSN